MFKRNKLDPVKEAMALFNNVYLISMNATELHQHAENNARQAALSYLSMYQGATREVKNAKL